MATKRSTGKTTVSTTYRPGGNLSVTKKDGRIVKVTSWVTGFPAKDTERHYSK